MVHTGLNTRFNVGTSRAPRAPDIVMKIDDNDVADVPTASEF